MEIQHNFEKIRIYRKDFLIPKRCKANFVSINRLDLHKFPKLPLSSRKPSHYRQLQHLTKELFHITNSWQWKQLPEGCVSAAQTTHDRATWIFSQWAISVTNLFLPESWKTRGFCLFVSMTSYQMHQPHGLPPVYVSLPHLQTFFVKSSFSSEVIQKLLKAHSCSCQEKLPKRWSFLPV